MTACQRPERWASWGERRREREERAEGRKVGTGFLKNPCPEPAKLS